MVNKIQDVMTRDPLALASTETLAGAAKQMRDADVGVVVVLDNNTARGVGTVRDTVVRGGADGRYPCSTALATVGAHDLVTVRREDTSDAAGRLMRQLSVRRLPVVAGGKPVGVVSIGDLAVERDSDWAL